MSRKLMSIFVVFFAIVICGCSTVSPEFGGDGISPSSRGKMKSDFVGWKFKADNGVELMVREYIPSWVPWKIPLVVYLHGAGQNGFDNESQLDDSVGSIHSFMQGRDDYKAVILAPQCPIGVYWRDEAVLEALKELISKVSEDTACVDPDRICVTGFSMGGDATWQLALRWPELMTTIVPVCGGPLVSMESDVPNIPANMSDLNIWAFNNFDDGVVRPNYAKGIFGSLWSMDNGDHLNFTEYVEGGHSPKAVYSNRNILIWMMSVKRR